MTDVQIFMSYARVDDAPPPHLPDAKGFVTFLHEQLAFELRRIGAPWPKIWRDTKRIENADQFEPRIEQAISDSSILLVVLSKNWISRPYCVRELESFAERWKADGGLRERIVVAAKREVDPDRRPSLLQGQVGIKFYALDEHEEDIGGLEQEFYAGGRIRDPRYEDRIEELAGILWRKANRNRERTSTNIEQPLPTPRPEPRPPLPAVRPNGRTIFVAKPADDMYEAYDRVTKELQERGNNVVPPADVNIPHDSSALAFIDEALGAAAMSVHLLGAKAGFAPDSQDPIVKLQLARAAAKVGAPLKQGEGGDRQAFKRIIWAPKVLENDADTKTVLERDPASVLTQSFGSRQLDTDEIEGSSLTKFVTFLLQLPPLLPAKWPLPPGAKLYLHHRREDSDFVGMVIEALEQFQAVEAVYPAFDGPSNDVAALHLKRLAECDAVVLCWAVAPEVWIRAEADLLRDWHRLNRSGQFAYRGVIAGPPPHDRKKFLVQRPPRKEIDLVVDLTDQDRPWPEALRTLVAGVASSP